MLESVNNHCNLFKPINIVSFSGLYQNVRGLRTKLNVLNVNIHCLNYDFYALTETWLCDSIHDNELGFSNFNVFRVDRCLLTSNHNRGGGVAICVNRKFISSQLKPPITNVEQVFVEVKINQKEKIFLVVCYIPPGSPSSIYTSFVNSLEWLLTIIPSENKIIVLGDFNLPKASFISNNDGLQLSGVHSESSEVIYDFFSENDFLQYNQVLNKFNSQLDLIFSNVINTIVSQCSDELVPVDSHHPVLSVFCEVSSTLFTTNDVSSTYNYSRADFDLINYALITSDWSTFYNENCVNKACDEFYRIVFNVVQSIIPRTVVNKSRYPIWYSSELRNNIRLKNAVHKKYKISGNHSDYILFSNLRKTCKNLSKCCYHNHLIRIQNSLIVNPKYF